MSIFFSNPPWWGGKESEKGGLKENVGEGVLEPDPGGPLQV